ncbi:MAG: DNA repair protein RecN [Deltaproteobacteria bacterium]|nr:DNA repair protein RecN [Deltaproteobacteria bacterium]
MLVEFTVRHLAIIDDLTLPLGPGLNVLTGETGAGKSILVGALNLAVGGRASADAIRHGEKSAEVEAIFDLTTVPVLLADLEAQGLVEGGRLIIRRVITANGPNRVFMGGRTATLAQLAAIGDALVAISGQHDSKGLLSSETHLNILDEFGSAPHVREPVVEGYRTVVAARDRLASLRDRERQATARADYLRFVIREIEGSGFERGEDERLRDRRRVLVSAEKLGAAAKSVLAECWEQERSISERSGRLQRQVEDALAIDPSFEPMAQALATLAAAAEDAGRAAQGYLESLELEPGELERIDERLDAMRMLSKKYGGSLGAVLDTFEGASRELAEISSLDAAIVGAEKESRAAEEKLTAAANRLSEVRRAAATKLARRVQAELADLGMKGAKFEVRFEPLPAGAGIEIDGQRIDENGAERAEMFLSANAGETPRALARVASGGELSRILLAIKNSLAAADGVPCQVFDEVDSGLGGAQAEIVGLKLAAIARDHQVLCITHLPQIAGFADRHVVVKKETSRGRTVTTTREVEGREREQEIARMLAGLDVTDAALAAAREMIKPAARGAGESR